MSRHLSSINLLVGLLLSGFVGFSYLQMTTSREDFTQASTELKKCLPLVSQIEKLRAKPDQATLETHPERALAHAIEQSAAKAGVTRDHIARIEPQTPRRAGDSSYLEHTTVVRLESVTLGQLAQLTTNLRQSDASLGQLHVTALRVDAPYQGDQPDQQAEGWNVEFTLTYFVYSPKNSPAQAI